VSFPKNIHDEAVVTTPTAYYRFHGVPKLFYSEYDESFLAGIVSQLSSQEEVVSAYLYFNNTASLAALKNAKAVQTMLANTTP
jgi:uncharacterized protein YecE (DUF72 family)